MEAFCALNDDVLGEIYSNISLSCYYALRHTSKYISASVRKYFVDNLRQKWFANSPYECIVDHVKANNIVFVEWLYRYRRVGLPVDVVCLPEGENTIIMLKFLQKLGYEITYRAILENIKRGNIEVVEYCWREIKGGIPSRDALRKAAAKSRSIETIKWVHKKTGKKFRWSEQERIVRSFKCENDPMLYEIMKWITETDKIYDTAVIEAAYRGYFDLVKWLMPHLNLSELNDIYPKLINFAVIHDNIEMFDLLSSRVEDVKVKQTAYPRSIEMANRLIGAGILPTASWINGNIEEKNTPMIEFLLDKNCPLNTYTGSSAIKARNINILDILRARGLIVWSHIIDAISYKDLDVFIYIMDATGASIDLSVISHIIIHDSLEILKWVLEFHSYTLTEENYRLAITHRSYSILEWSGRRIRKNDILRGSPTNIHKLLRIYLRQKSRKTINCAILPLTRKSIIYVLQNTNKHTTVSLGSEPLYIVRPYSGRWSLDILNSLIGKLINGQSYETLDWLFDRSGCPVIKYDIVCCLKSYTYHNDHGKNLIARYASEGNIFDEDIMVYAASARPDLIKWMHLLGGPLNKLLFARILRFEAGGRADEHILKWLIDNNCPVPGHIKIKKQDNQYSITYVHNGMGRTLTI